MPSCTIFQELDITPGSLGLPAKFSSFRAAQLQALDFVVYESQRKVTALGLPTGIGKTLLAFAIARALGVKAVYLTATRALEDAASAEMSSISADVRGWANYECRQMYFGSRRPPSCEYGAKNGCRLTASPDCPRTAAVLAAESAQIITSNYACWMHARRYNRTAFEGDGPPVQLLICDEAGAIPDQVSSFVSVQIDFADEELPISFPGSGQELPSGLMPEEPWVTWAKERKLDAVRDMARIAESYRTKQDALRDDRYKYLAELCGRCDQISEMNANWVWEVSRDGVKFEPIWPAAHMHALWSGVPRVIPMSATLRPYTLKLMGLRREDYDFREWPAVFPPQYGPNYYLPSGIKLTWKSSEEDLRGMVAWMDDILDARADRRVLVDGVSYDRCRQVKRMSRNAARIINNETGRDTRQALADFRNSPPDAVLLGPSFRTGHDFAGAQCEVIIGLKTPYPNSGSRVMQERCKDSEYRMHKTVEELVQLPGRGRRHATDRCEFFTGDAGIKWAMGPPSNPWHGHAPSWFRMQTISRIPPAPPKMREEK